MHTVMKELRKEHKGHRQLLALLNNKLVRLAQGIPPNYQLIEDTINYIDNYAGRYHHPKEDVIYQYMLAHNLDKHGQIVKIMEQHKNFQQLTKPLQDSLQSILLDIIVSRATFISQLKHYILTEKAHLDCEEKHIFTLIDSALCDDDWTAILVSMPQQSDDPLFGEQVQEEYKNLYRRLREMDNEK